MHLISLKEFVLTGNFGPVNKETPLADVVKLLGEPGFQDNSLSQGYITALCYGRYEFFFYTETGLLHGIQNDQLEADCSNHDEMINYKNDYFEVDTWFLEAGKDMTCEELVLLLQREEIKFLFNTKKGYPEIQFESGVAFDFTVPEKAVKSNAAAVNAEDEFKKWKNEKLIGIRYYVR